MNLNDIQLLQQMRSYPALTITLPTHRTSPENRQDPIRVRNLVNDATERLLQEFSKREIDPLLTRLQQVTDTLDYRHTSDGLAIFVNQEMAQAYAIPHTLPEQVIIDETFATRKLVYALNRSARYWVLVLSEQPTRLYEGNNDILVEIQNSDFPMTHEGPGGATALPGGEGINRSAHRDEHQRQFFRQVDAAFSTVAAGDPLPLVVVGVDRNLAFFQEVTDHRRAIIATLLGSHDKTSPHELGQLVWPLVNEAVLEKKQQALVELDRANSEQKLSSTVGEVWRKAHEGRGKLLLVEKNFYFPGRLDESGVHLFPADDSTQPGVIDDAVDEIIETVLQKQGEVVFLEEGQLAQHQRIALILRY
jgi:hypothetical protein